MSSTMAEKKKSSFDQAVLAYKYSSPNLSILETIVLNQFWESFVNVYPLWLAPNIITLVGGECCLLMYHLNWYFSPKGLGQGEPQLLYCFFASLLFAYQTLDGTDGKQARRTKSGSALGELMDHGVDALITGFVAFVVTDALGLGMDCRAVWMSIIGGQMAFYASNLTLLHRGKLQIFPVDIMELQWVMILVLATSGLFGSSIWRETTFAIPQRERLEPAFVFVAKVLDVSDFVQQGTFQARFVIAVGAVGGTVLNFFMYCTMCFVPYFTNQALVHPGVGLVQLAKQILIILTYGALCTLNILHIMRIKDEGIRFQAYRALLMTICFAFGDLMDRLLVMRVSHLPFKVLSPTLALVSLFATYTFMGVHTPQFPFLWFVAFLAVLMHAGFAYWVSRKLAKVLGISVFTIKKLKE